MKISTLHQKTVLVLNRHWLPVSTITPADAFCHLVAGTADALRISPDTMLALKWADWRGLPATHARSIGTKDGRVLIPTVIVLSRYDGLPMCRPSFGFRALWARDRGRCQYSGRQLAIHEADIDHIIPRSGGGRDSWENCVISDRIINRTKGAKTPKEASLSLIRKPSVPRPVPVTHTIENTYQIEDWKHFVF